MEIIIHLLVIFIFGYGFGKFNEKKHLKSIVEREKKYNKMPIIGKKEVTLIKVGDSILVQGNVVISIDAFKKFIFGFIKIFGGEVFVYESLIDRARREAILRMKQQAEKFGCNGIANMRIETSSISKGAKNTIGSVEILAYGTGIKILQGNTQ